MVIGRITQSSIDTGEKKPIFDDLDSLGQLVLLLIGALLSDGHEGVDS